MLKAVEIAFIPSRMPLPSIAVPFCDFHTAVLAAIINHAIPGKMGIFHARTTARS
jgi:hypothetical protein